MRDSTADFENSTPAPTTRSTPKPTRFRYRVALVGKPGRFLGSTHPGIPEEMPEQLAYCYDTPQEAYLQAIGAAGYDPDEIEIQRMVTWGLWIPVDTDVTGNWADAEFHGRSSR